jgi:hypothetical protein
VSVRRIQLPSNSKPKNKCYLERFVMLRMTFMKAVQEREIASNMLVKEWLLDKDARAPLTVRSIISATLALSFVHRSRKTLRCATIQMSVREQAGACIRLLEVVMVFVKLTSQCLRTR